MPDTPDDTLTYRLERGPLPTLVVRVPRDWRITFGPPMHGEQTTRGPIHGATVRFYDGRLQRAAYMGITAYHAVTPELEIVEDKLSKPSYQREDEQLPF